MAHRALVVLIVLPESLNYILVDVVLLGEELIRSALVVCIYLTERCACRLQRCSLKSGWRISPLIVAILGRYPMKDLLVGLVVAALEENVRTRWFHRYSPFRLIVATVLSSHVLVWRGRVLLLKILLVHICTSDLLLILRCITIAIVLLFCTATSVVVGHLLLL